MAILINNMKMPEEGKQFVVTVENGTWIFQERWEPAKIFIVSEIPSHGRLIDADALREKFPRPQDWMSIAQALVHITGIWAEIDNAPTIIPATNKE